MSKHASSGGFQDVQQALKIIVSYRQDLEIARRLTAEQVCVCLSEIVLHSRVCARFGVCVFVCDLVRLFDSIYVAVSVCVSPCVYLGCLCFCVWTCPLAALIEHQLISCDCMTRTLCARFGVCMSILQGTSPAHVAAYRAAAQQSRRSTAGKAHGINTSCFDAEVAVRCASVWAWKKMREYLLFLCLSHTLLFSCARSLSFFLAITLSFRTNSYSNTNTSTGSCSYINWFCTAHGCWNLHGYTSHMCVSVSICAFVCVCVCVCLCLCVSCVCACACACACACVCARSCLMYQIHIISPFLVAGSCHTHLCYD